MNNGYVFDKNLIFQISVNLNRQDESCNSEPYDLIFGFKVFW